MRLVRSSLAVVLPSLALGACVLATDLDGFSDSPAPTSADDAAPEALAPTDAPTDAPIADAAPNVGDAADAAPTNLFPEGTFERPGDCSGTGYHSTLAIDSVAHGGTRACRVCAVAGTSGSFSFDEKVEGLVPEVGATYRVEAWVQRVPGAKTPASVTAHVRTFRLATNGDFVDIQNEGGDPSAVPETWTRITAELTPSKPAPLLDVFVSAQLPTTNANGECFLVDDVVVTRTK